MLSIFGSLACLLKSYTNVETDSEYIDLKDYPETEIIDIIIYPCRGVAGIHLDKAYIEKSGIPFDREWFLLQKDMDEDKIKKPGKRWVSINRCDKVAQIQCKFIDQESTDGSGNTKYLVFSHPEKHEDLWIDTTQPATKEVYDLYNFEKHKIE